MIWVGLCRTNWSWGEKCGAAEGWRCCYCWRLIAATEGQTEGEWNLFAPLSISEGIIQN